MPSRRCYSRNQSRLFRLKSPAQLCQELKLAREQLNRLLRAKDNYIRWVDQESGRPIQRPKPILENAHKRVAVLLGRIETPDFLHSAVKARSYVTNAAAHRPDVATVKIDIKKFYPSTRAQEVFHFFRDRMECDGDVAGMLARLLTVDGHLATGSSASPILSFFAYEEMFHEMEQLAASRQCEMSCYVDDLVFSGPGATRRLIFDLIEIVKRYRLWAHKTKIFKAGQPKVITGVAVTKVGSRLPNKRKRTISEDYEALEIASSLHDQSIIMGRLRSRLFEAAQIDEAWKPAAQQISERLKAL